MEVREWMSSTHAETVMAVDVVTLTTTDRLAEAAARLLQEGISGAPVVDETGTCVGVLSGTDILGTEEEVDLERTTVIESSYYKWNLALPERVYAEKLAEIRDRVAPAAEQPVERFMTSDLVSVARDTPLVSVIGKMVHNHIHRVLILDTDGRLQGIISTTDVLAAILRAAK